MKQIRSRFKTLHFSRRIPMLRLPARWKQRTVRMSCLWGLTKKKRVTRILTLARTWMLHLRWKAMMEERLSISIMLRNKKIRQFSMIKKIKDYLRFKKSLPKLSRPTSWLPVPELPVSTAISSLKMKIQMLPLRWTASQSSPIEVAYWLPTWQIWTASLNCQVKEDHLPIRTNLRRS